jgi:hypothetical protein
MEAGMGQSSDTSEVVEARRNSDLEKACGSLSICIALVLSLRTGAAFGAPPGIVGTIVAIIMWVIQTAIIYAAVFIPLYFAAKFIRSIFAR